MAMACAPVVSASGDVRHGGSHRLAEREHTADERLADPLSGASSGISDSGIGSTGRATMSGQSDWVAWLCRA